MIHHGDCRDILPTLEAGSIHCCVTSPPYWGLRDYGVDGQLGLEQTPAEYVEQMVAVFREVRRVLRDDGTLWLNLGDSYNAQQGQQNLAASAASTRGGGHKTGSVRYNSVVRPRPPGLKLKDLVGIPWSVAFVLREDGWFLRQDIIWSKPNPMPESVTDRCTKAHEYIFLLSKSAKYYYDADAIKEPALTGGQIGGGFASLTTGVAYQAVAANRRPSGNQIPERSANYIRLGNRNRRSVWTVATRSFPGVHFATFPPKLIEPCIKAGCPEGGVVLDPFMGAGTTAVVAQRLGCQWIGCELNQDYIDMAEKRLKQKTLWGPTP